MKRKPLVVTLALAAAVALTGLVAPSPATAKEGDDVLLAAFWNSDQDLTNTVYMSTNGTDFQKLSAAYPTDGNGNSHVTGAPNYVNALHDPGIFYKDGNFWMVGGYTQEQAGIGWRFTPMLGSSKDLVHWSYPNSGSATNLAPTVAPNTAGKYQGGRYDSAGTDAMADDNGDVWIVTTLGYYGGQYGDSAHDVMAPYLVKVSGLRPGADQAANPGAQPQLSYGSLVPVKLPDGTNNWLDPSLYKENGRYYLSIKKNGVTNMVYSIDDLSRCGDAGAWRLENGNVITGYEGPSLAKLGDRYFFYTDKLKDYPAGTSDTSTGTFVRYSKSLGSGWSDARRITTTDVNGRSIPNRHGSVVRISDPAAKQVIWNLRKQLGYKGDTTGAEIPRFSDVNSNDWYVTGGLFDYALDEGLMSGYNGTDKFGPYDYITRGQVACVLHNMAGNPTASSANFNDVDYNQYYGKAIRWARATGVINGYGDTNTFGPNDKVTREQLAAMLANYASKIGKLDTSSDCAKLDAIAGADRVSSWARTSMGWAVDEGLLGGVNTNSGKQVRPQDNAWRASVATMSAKLDRDVLK